jgi:hypothetical protein
MTTTRVARYERDQLDDCGEREVVSTARRDEAPGRGAAGPWRRAVWLRGSSVVLFYTWLTVLLTWPIALDLWSRFPAHIDPPFSAWRLARVAHQLEHDPRNLFDGEIFWPARRTLAYSDAMLLQGALAWPLLRAGVPPIAAVNILTFVGVIASAVGAYVLARRLTGHTGAALVAGLVFAFSPFRRDHFVHLELQWAQWIPLALWAWHRALDGGRLRDGLLCAAFVLLQLLSSIYYAMFLAVACLVVGAATLAARQFRIATRVAVGLTIGAVAVAAAGAKYGEPYQLVKERVGERSVEETTRYSALPSDYLRATFDSLLYGYEPRDTDDDERQLFPGLTPLALAGVAVVPPVSAAVVAYGACTLVGWDASLGMNGRIFPLLRGLEAFRGLRAPARFAVIVQLGLGVLAAFGLARLARRWPRASGGIVTAAAALTIAEYAGQPLEHQTMPKEPPGVYRWLASEPRQVTLELPVPEPLALPRHDPFFMYAATWHWQPLVNGYSGHYARGYLDLLPALEGLPDEASIEALQRAGVQRIIVHAAMYKPDAYRRLVDRLAAHPMFHLTRVTDDHLDEVRVFTFLPNFGPRD